jgi:hypothetical protein
MPSPEGSEPAGQYSQPGSESSPKNSQYSLDLGPRHDDPFREPAVRETPVERESDDAIRVGASLGVEQRTFELSTSLVGLYAGFSLERAVLGLSLLRGEAQTGLGTITSMLGNLSFGYQVAQVANGRWTLAVTPRLGVGSVLATSRAVPGARSRSASEIYGDAAARILVGAGLWSHLHLVLLSEAGYARGMVVTADGDPQADYPGVFLGVALAASFTTPAFQSGPPQRVAPDR